MQMGKKLWLIFYIPPIASIQTLGSLHPRWKGRKKRRKVCTVVLLVVFYPPPELIMHGRSEGGVS